VLFVSHNLAAVRSLCSRGILLREGSVYLDGEVSAVVREYLRGLEQVAAHQLLERQDRSGSGAARLAAVEISTPGRPNGALVTGDRGRFRFRVAGTTSGVSCSFTIYDQLGQPVTAFDSASSSPDDLIGSGTDSTFDCEIDQILLIPGRYRLNAAIARGGELLDRLEAAALFDVEHGIVSGRPISDHARHGSTVMPHRWSTPA
jgi:lipopolysaccharide transport system ATP-binding protein